MTTGKKVQELLSTIYQEYGLGEGQDCKIPMINLFDKNFKILKDHNRHEALLRVMISLMIRLGPIMSEEEIKLIAYNWNQTRCEPPLDDKEFERQWKDAKKFTSTKALKSFQRIGWNETNQQRKQLSLKEKDEKNLIQIAAESILSKTNFITIEESQEILYYKDGVYIKQWRSYH